MDAAGELHRGRRLCCSTIEYRGHAEVWNNLLLREHGEAVSYRTSTGAGSLQIGMASTVSLAQFRSQASEGAWARSLWTLQNAKDDAWAMHPGLVENRETSLLETLEMWERWNGEQMIASAYGSEPGRLEGRTRQCLVPVYQ